MDIRDYTLTPGPDMPHHVDPGVRPPSLIFSSGQYYPPYELADDLPEPLPGCQAQYATVCAVQHAIRLVTRARIEACPNIEAGGTLKQDQLEAITNNAFEAEGASKFGVFVIEENGTILADALRPSLVGERFDGYLNAGLIAQPTLLDFISYVVSWDGGFVPHYTTRFEDTQPNVMAGDAPVDATAYMEKCATGERLGVAIGFERLPSDDSCDANTNDFCALQNTRSVVGLDLVNALNAHTPRQMANLFYQISYAPEHDIGNFYNFLFIGNYMGENATEAASIAANIEPMQRLLTAAAHGGGFARYSNGWNLTHWVTGDDVGNMSRAQWLHTVNNGDTGGRYQDYEWETAALGVHTKVSFCIGYTHQSISYVLGSGMTHKPATRALAPRCATCNISVSWPCSFQNARRMASHAFTEFLTPDSDLEEMAKSKWFGSLHEDAVEGEQSDKWPAGFTFFAFSYDGTCAGDGHSASNAGKDFSELFPDATLHDRFKVAASAGGGWVEYQNTQGETRIALVTKMARSGTFYYLASSFVKAWPDWISSCASAYMEPCSESNAQALLGKAAADILSASDADELADRILTIAGKTGEYSSDLRGDFKAYVLTSKLECWDGTSCPSWPSFWLTDLGTTMAQPDGGWVSLAAKDEFSESYAYIISLDWLNPTTTDTETVVLVTFVTATTAPPQCDPLIGTGCPENAECSEEGRCVCSDNYRENYTLDTDYCGALTPSTLVCVNVENMLCSSTDASNCVPCPAGYFCQGGSRVACGAGYVCDGTGVELCPRGTMGNQSLSTSFEFCESCPAGTYSAVEGSTTCASCAAGTSSDGVGASACSRCDVGTYQDEAGGTACISCPSGFTTMFQSAQAESDCVCAEGTYLPLASESCSYCPEAMSCDSDNVTESAIYQTMATGPNSDTPYPVAQEGYATLIEKPLAPYKCKENKWCPGGGPGVCAANRDSSVFGCAKCLPNFYTTDDGSCTGCAEGQSGIFVGLGVICFLISLACFAVMVNRNQLNQSSAMTVIVISLGLTVTAIQTLNILSSLAVGWQEPVKTMFKGLAIAAFNPELLQVECTVGNNSVVNLIMRQIIAPAASVYICLVVVGRKLILKHDGEALVEMINAVGGVFQVFFVAIFLNTLAPFICYSHPGDNGRSMSSEPAVLCNNEGDHAAMVAVSSVALVIVILPYLSLILFATVRYQYAINRPDSSARHLKMFRFLFFRYQPKCYWYGGVTLMRGSLICLVPVVFGDEPSLQLMGMSGVLLAFCSLQLSTKPWRGLLPNIIDATTCILMALLVLCVAMSTDFESSDTMLGALAATLFVAVFVAVTATVCYAGFRHFFPAKYFHSFLCAYKAEAGAQARYLQTLLQQRSTQRCFLDSDHLADLEELFDIVRCRCGRLLVYLTTDTLKRPWVVGEITVTWQIHQRAFAIEHPSWVKPSIRDLKEENVALMFPEGDCKLVEYGVTDEAVALALRWISYELTARATLRLDLVGRQRFFQLADEILKRESPRRNSEPDERKAANAVLLSTVPGDDEALAVGGILAGLLAPRLQSQVPAGIILLEDMQDVSGEKAFNIVKAAHAVIVVLSPTSLEVTEQLQVIVDTVGENSHCVPVSTPNFRVPGPHFFEHELHTRFGEEAGEIENRLRRFFRVIATPFAPGSTIQVLEAQAETVLQRLQGTKPNLQAAKTSTMPSTRSGGLQLSLSTAEFSTVSSRSVSRGGSSSTVPFLASSVSKLCGEIVC